MPKHKPLRVITQDFELLTEIDQYESALPEYAFHGIGKLDLVVNRHTQDASLLQRGVLLFIGSDTDNPFIIKSRDISLDESGRSSENWEISALSLKSILSQRITRPTNNKAYDRITGTAEEVMKHYVNQNVVNPSDDDLIIPQIEIAENQNRGETITWQSRYNVLSDELEDISRFSGLGWDLTLDLANQKWIFDVIESTNRTTDQADNPPVIFSPEFDSIRSMSYGEDEIDYRNVAIVAGEGEGADRRIVIVGGSDGISRHELFVDARDVSEEDDDGNQRSESEIIEELEARGQQELDDYNQEVYLEAESLTYSPFQYKRDFFLGDVVTVQHKNWGVMMHTRITRIREVIEASGYQVEVVFGHDKPTLTDKVKRRFQELERELKK